MNDVRSAVAVWRPAEHWRSDDDAVELQLRKYRDQWLYPVAHAGTLLMLALFDVVTGSVHVSTVLCVLGALAVLSMAVTHYVQVGRWLPAARRLPTNGQARQVAARVVGHRRGVTTLAAGDQYLRVQLLDWGLRQVVARSGEITLLGPDANGEAAVFVDGRPTPLPAKVVATPEKAEAEPIARVSWRGAEDEVPNWLVARRARIWWVVLAAPVLLTAALVYDAQQSMTVIVRPEVSGTATFNWFFAAAVACGAVAVLHLALASSRLRKLLAAGSWQGYPATILTWKGQERQMPAALTLRLHLPDGEVLPVLVKLASAELVANIDVTGTVWLIGPPAPRKTTAVGVPGHPIVATARFV